MPSPKLQCTALALALSQAFVVTASAQVSEVVITGARANASGVASVGGFGNAAVLDTPASIDTITRATMDDLGIRSTTDAMKLDASVADSYNAVGYAEQFSIRGFNLDNTSSYRKDGFAIPGDTQIPLENKERIEVLKGLAGLQAGVAAPGGVINYVTKRPTATDLRSATVGASERGTLYGAADIGGRFGDTRFGYRINAAAERLRPYVRGANGERQFASGAFDWQITPQALLQLDMDYQHKSQISAPGYQLIGGVALPTGISPSTLLNAQPWTKPVVTDSTNLGLRFEYAIGDGWHATFAANKHWFRRDDFTAFPYGCSSESLWPGYCANGDYDVYDYQSTGEKKQPFGISAQLQGQLVAGGLRHDLTFGASRFERHDSFGDYVYDWAGVSNIYHNVIVPPAAGNPHTGPVYERNTEKEDALYVQDIVGFGEEFKLHAGLRYVDVKRTMVDVDPAGFKEHFLLPNLALVYKPSAGLTLYGSLAHGMEHGGVAPFGTANENLPLAPSRSKQVEVGVKGSFGDALDLSAALFQVRRGLEYTGADNTFVRNGDETHRGIELSAQGRVGGALQYGLSAMALSTRQQGTGDATLDGRRVTNVPAFKSSAWIEYALAQAPGLKLNAMWQYSGKKAFDKENQVFVPGYHVLNLGASYDTHFGATAVTLRAGVDNVFDKAYWRDVTPLLGGYLFPGAPRVYKVSAQFSF